MAVSPFSVDLTITAGNIIEILVISGGGLLALSKFSTKFALFHVDLTGVKTDVGDLKTDIKKVNELLANAKETDRRIGRIEDDISDLRRGDGFIQGGRGVDREYAR